MEIALKKKPKINDRYLMDGHKLLWHLDRVSQWLNGERIAPLHIDLGITTGCNEACTYCYGVIQARTTGARRFNMPKDGLLRFLKDAKEAGVRSIAFVGEGENTLNDALYDGLSFAKKIDLDISLATNGLQIKKDRIEDMMSSLAWIRFNISAASADSYFKIHGVRSLAKVIDNIKSCVDIKKKLKLKTAVGLQMVVVRENIDDIVPLAGLGRDLGVDYLVIKPCSDTYDETLKAPREEYLEIEDLLEEAEGYTSGDYVVSVKWKKTKNLGLKDYSVCYGTPFLLHISGDGSVFPCGHWFHIRREEFKMGNVLEAPFKDIVKSERYWQVQKRVQLVNVNKECESNCRHYYINQFLWGLKNKPEHVNFI